MKLQITRFLFMGLLFLQPHFSKTQTFTQVTNSENPINQVTINGLYRGAAWVDIDNDGDLDLSIQGWAFRNDGGDNFSIVKSFGKGPAGGAPEILGSVSWADYDNDDDLDCLYSAAVPSGGTASLRTIIYENDGKGNFSEKMIDRDGAALSTWSSSWSDYNNDGSLDIICAVANGFIGLNTPSFFYRGNADGTFTKIDTFEFTKTLAPYTVAYWSDYDRDGDSDLFIASGPGGNPGPDFHFQNMLMETGKEGLKRMNSQKFATDPQDGQCYNFIDFDLDGDSDIFLTNYNGAPNRFYEKHDQTLQSNTSDFVFDGPMLGNCWGDFDNDGDQDVIITGDNIALAGYFKNENGRLVKTMNPFENIFDATNSNVSGLTIGDYDNDGDLDFFANGGVQGQSGPRALFRNDLSNENHWINISCKGTKSNRAALGAVLYLTTKINGKSITQQREITAQNTFMGHNSLRVHFGLGKSAIIESLSIHWPSGQKDEYSNVKADKFYVAVEGQKLEKLKTK